MTPTSDIIFSEDDLDTLLDNLDSFNPEEIAEIDRMATELTQRKLNDAAHDDLLTFAVRCFPEYIIGRHHKILAKQLMAIEAGRKDRICVNIPPRHGKSMLVSTIYPAWFLGRNPTKKVMMVSHTTDLAVDFGRKVRNLVDSSVFAEIFPTVNLSKDNKSAGRWNTNLGGEFFACGIGSSIAGRGADLLLIDDPHALEINTLIPTPNGFVAINNLRVGDEVFGPDGYPTKIIGKSEVWHDRELYSAVTSDGEEILCDAQHLWGVNSDTNLNKAKVYNFSAEYIANWPKANRPILPKHQAVEYPHADLPIDPWVLGAWLGDGTSSSGRITACPEDQEYMMSELRKAGYTLSPLTKDGFTFTVYGLMAQLRTLGVLNNKHVPEIYLTASVEQRLSLLQGLVDTDGAVMPSGQAGFYNCNLKLVEAAKEILHSLGVRCQVRSYEDTRGRYKTAKTNHRVMFRVADCARMPRKLRFTRTPSDKRSRSIEIENTGVKGSVQCITVERKDGLFLAGRGYVVTHNSEQDVLNGNFEVFDKAYEWFAFGARTRLMPGGRVAIIQCMTGDTPVLMSDSTTKQLSNICVGDVVASYDKGKKVNSKVLNHKSSGIDYVFTIRTTCGKTVRANKRHPFLVQHLNGETQWVRLKDLKVGNTLVSLRAAQDLQEPLLNAVNVEHASQKTRGIRNTQMQSTYHLGIMGSINTKLVQLLSVGNPQRLMGCVTRATAKTNGLEGLTGAALRKIGKLTLNTGMVYQWQSTMRYWKNKVAIVLSANNRQQSATPVHTGMESYALTTAMTLGRLERFCATIATLQLGTQRVEQQPSPLQSISEFTPSQIASIEAYGQEEVFDVEVENTENFIANGIVSHNTRWHMDDLTGQVVRDMVKNPGSDQYEVVEFPAILDFTSKRTGKVTEKPLWPEFFDLAALLKTKASMPVFQWNAQYQQNPTAEEGSVVKREWWREWTKDEPPEVEYIIMSADTAAETKNRNDFSVFTLWGVFMNEEENRHDIIGLDCIKKRLEFPELKDMAYELYQKWEPDCFIVEKKSSGVALYQEMRRTGIPVQEFTPHRGSGDKLARLNAVADIVRSGMVWLPVTRWADEVIEEIAAFPFGTNDDIVDSTTMALSRFRSGGFIRLDSDEPEEQKMFKSNRGNRYY